MGLSLALTLTLTQVVAAIRRAQRHARLAPQVGRAIQLGGGRARLGRLRHARLRRPRPPVLQARRLRRLRAPGTVNRVVLVAVGWPAKATGQEPKGPLGCSGRRLARLGPPWR